MLQAVDRILLRVPALDAAVAYYRDVLRLRLVRHEKGLASFALQAGTELVLHDSPDLPAQGIYFRVESVTELFERKDELKLKFTSPPRPSTRGRTAAVKDPFGNVLQLLDLSKQAQSGNAIESAAPAGGALFAGVEPRLKPKPDLLAAAYEKAARTADDLPYTHHFESLYEQYAGAFDPPRPSRQEVWRHLLNCRKAGKLPKLGDARSQPPDATDTERNLLVSLLGDAIGRRDRLPYSDQFQGVLDAFNKTTRRTLTPHQLWRLICTVAK